LFWLHLGWGFSINFSLGKKEGGTLRMIVSEPAADAIATEPSLGETSIHGSY
jgi:hypothetical protein